MAKEIERKFLVDLTKLDTKKYTNWTVSIQQGYLSTGHATVRIRIEDKKGFITIKGKTEGISRNEYEYEIPFEDATELIKMCKKTIFKKRTTIKFNQRYWVVDVFEGDNEGLVIAELELKSEKEKFSLPPWVLNEVSSEDKYYNCKLIDNPYKNW
jgi:adenylate cyclase